MLPSPYAYLSCVQSSLTTRILSSDAFLITELFPSTGATIFILNSSPEPVFATVFSAIILQLAIPVEDLEISVSFV